MYDDYAYLTTTGRVTGRSHEIEIWYERSDHTIWLMAGAGHRSDWVRNLTADPTCEIRLGYDGEPWPARARFPVGDEARAIRDALYTKYQPRNAGDLAGWREDALPVALDTVVTT